MNKKNNIIIYEYSEPNEDDSNKLKTLEEEQEFLTKLKQYLEKNELKNVFSFNFDKTIKANNYVGVVKYKNIQFSILPKIAKNVNKIGEQEIKEYNKNIYKNLIYMLFFTKKLNIKFTDTASLSTTQNPFLEILINIFAENLFNGLKKQSINNYVRRSDNLSYVKGKINFSKNIKYNWFNSAKIYCEYDEFIENNRINQMFLFIAKILFTVSISSQNKKLLSNIINYYCDIDFIFFDKNKIKNIQLNRNQLIFQIPFDLAKMFIENATVNLSRGEIENIAIVWDMNILFEEFVYCAMKKYLKEYNVEYQKKKPLFKDKDQKGIRPMTYSDIIISKGNEKIIIDTKYKVVKKDDNSRLNYNNDDLYQVITYSIINQSKQAILLYPQYDDKTINFDDAYGMCNNTDIRVNLMTINLQYDNLQDKIRDEINKFEKNIRYKF